MFRQLTEQEKSKFRQWARVNYIPHTEINSVWHPVVQAECHRINKEIEAKLSENGTEILEKQSLETK